MQTSYPSEDSSPTNENSVPITQPILTKREDPMNYPFIFHRDQTMLSFGVLARLSELEGICLEIRTFLAKGYCIGDGEGGEQRKRHMEIEQ